MSERIVADLHLHSRFARATSRNLDLAALEQAAFEKGVDLLSASDFTHPVWLKEIKAELAEAAPGVFRRKGAGDDAPCFVLGTEVSCVWTQKGRGRRVHILLFAPDFEAVDGISGALEPSCNLEEDGRPSLGISARDLADLVWGVDERCEVIPAHAWTPWYGIYGSKSGFDSMEECFGDATSRIRAIETGLSSDPAMNWAVRDVDPMAILSFSDAHSAPNLAREATVFDMERSYEGLRKAIANQSIIETIEFFPENGKYHLDGHRKCGVRMTPEESAKLKGRCPVCGRRLTLGVLHRVQDLAGGLLDEPPAEESVVHGPKGRPPYRRLVPLRDLLSAAFGVGRETKTVLQTHDALLKRFGSELGILMNVSFEDLEFVAGEKVARAVTAARNGDLTIEPGYDGVYGIVQPRLESRRPG